MKIIVEAELETATVVVVNLKNGNQIVILPKKNK